VQQVHNLDWLFGASLIVILASIPYKQSAGRYKKSSIVVFAAGLFGALLSAF
jgi:hypothetical protein